VSIPLPHSREVLAVIKRLREHGWHGAADFIEFQTGSKQLTQAAFNTADENELASTPGGIR
jgi:hypothetical protein